MAILESEVTRQIQRLLWDLHQLKLCSLIESPKRQSWRSTALPRCFLHPQLIIQATILLTRPVHSPVLPPPGHAHTFQHSNFKTRTSIFWNKCQTSPLFSSIFSISTTPTCCFFVRLSHGIDRAADGAPRHPGGPEAFQQAADQRQRLGHGCHAGRHLPARRTRPTAQGAADDAEARLPAVGIAGDRHGENISKEMVKVCESTSFCWGKKHF